MCNKLLALSNDTLDPRRCNIPGRTLTISVDHTGEQTSTPWELTFLPWTFPPSDIPLTLACDRIRQEVQVLRWAHAIQVTNQLRIINRQ